MAFDNYGLRHQVKWQIEQNAFCQRILKKHWPDSKIYDDIKTTKEIEPVDIMIGGFPCQDISVAGKQKGIEHGEKSSLWFEMLRIISDIRPRIVVLENVPAIIRVGGSKVVGGLAAIGYDCEWTIISARQFGAPHLRKRWFCVATDAESKRARINKQRIWRQPIRRDIENVWRADQKTSKSQTSDSDQNEIRNRWRNFPTQPPFCDGNDGVPDRVARLKALGNAIVPQCSQWVFEQIIKSGLLEDRGQCIK